MSLILWHIHLAVLAQFILPLLTLANSPQLCYYANDTLASEDIIPCYTLTTSDHYSCCKVGDKCLRHNSCYSLEFGVTYQYGCTDSTYHDSHCPWKCDLDTERSHWVGLVFCNGTDHTPNNTWVCHHPDNCGARSDCLRGGWEPELQKLWGTTCPNINYGDQYVAFQESSTLSDIAALPVKTELSSWWGDHADRTVVTSSMAMTLSGVSVSTHTTTSARETDQAVSTATSSTTSPPISSTDQAGTAITHRTTKTIGLGIGIGIGVPILLSLAGLTIFYVSRQRTKRKTAPAATSCSSDEYPPEKGEVYASHAQQSELDGTPIFEIPASLHPSELQGSYVMGTSVKLPFVSPETAQEEFGTIEKVGEGVREQGSGSKVHELPS